MTDSTEAQNARAAGEAAIKAACDAGDYGHAVTLLLQTYSEELLSFLVARLGERSHAEDAFSLLAEDLWLALPKFEFRSSVRTWAYMVARHVAGEYARSPVRRKERHLSLSEHEQLSQLVERLRTRTEAFRQTAAKNQVRLLREQLHRDDQALLILRVDRQMEWRDIALVMSTREDGARVSPDDDTLEREAARLRKRFERVKGELKELARKAGLLQ